MTEDTGQHDQKRGATFDHLVHLAALAWAEGDDLLATHFLRGAWDLMDAMVDAMVERHDREDGHRA